MLTLRGVYAGYGGGDVLVDLDLEVQPSSVTCIIGPNGAGKSTVLRVVSGLLQARTGEISLGDTPIRGRAPADILALGIAQVPQSQALFPQMTVRENVLLGGYLIRRQRALMEQRYEAVAELVPLIRERANNRAGNLSGGQRRMVEIGRTLMLDPSVVLLDEPSLGLDPTSLAAVTGLIGDLHARGKTIVLVEQNVRLGLAMSTYAVVMEGGRTRLTGTPDDITSHPDIASLYLGAPRGVATGLSAQSPPITSDGSMPRSDSTRRATLRPGRPETEPPGWAVEPVK
jgi:branched-chain amino acid transport system ATP-binding protein